MDTITVLPEKTSMIGAREIVKSINSGKIKSVVVASNCPQVLVAKIPKGVDVKSFEGDQHQLGIKLGLPFPVSMVGYE